MDNNSGRHWYRFVDNGCLFGFVGSVLLLANQYVSGKVELLGAYSGVPVGVLGGAAILVIWWRSAKQGRFILGGSSGTFRFRIWHFGLVFAFGAIIGAVHIGFFERVPTADILGLVATFLIFGFVSLFSVGVLGIYWLQWRYGKRFYLAGLADNR